MFRQTAAVVRAALSGHARWVRPNPTNRTARATTYEWRSKSRAIAIIDLPLGLIGHQETLYTRIQVSSDIILNIPRYDSVFDLFDFSDVYQCRNAPASTYF
jgi:hypothetical protein